MPWRFGRAVVSAEDYARYRAARSRRNACLRRVADLKRKVEESLRQQRAAKGERERKRQRLAEVFDRTMKELVGPAAGGGMTLGARGLRPALEATAGVSGAGLGTLAAVIGFDLACLAAATAGIGFHPGFVIHDSPHNADIEEALYARVFDHVRRLEALSGRGPAGFQ